jgi:hypothetical protein
MEDFNGDEFIVFVLKMVDDEEIPHEAYDMDKSVHFRHVCPHNNMHGTVDVELELDGHHLVMRGWTNGQRELGIDDEWPVVQRCGSDDDALRFYLRVRRGFVAHNFEIVDA